MYGISDSGDLLLASCSQDAYIRLWRIAMETTAIDPAVDELKLTSNVFSIFEGDKFKVTVESVLIGKFEDKILLVFKKNIFFD